MAAPATGNDYKAVDECLVLLRAGESDSSFNAVPFSSQQPEGNASKLRVVGLQECLHTRVSFCIVQFWCRTLRDYSGPNPLRNSRLRRLKPPAAVLMSNGADTPPMLRIWTP